MKRIFLLKRIAFLFLVVFSLIAGSVRAQTSQTFLTSGTFTVPTGVTSITVYIWGAGGGGGGGATGSAYANGGGGGGGASSVNTVTVGSNTSYTITVGVGGTAGVANAGTGGTGGTTTVVGNVSGTFNATGGVGGVGSSGTSGGTFAGGSGGSTGTGTVFIGGAGSAGKDGTSSTTGVTGTGGGGAGSGSAGGAALTTCSGVGGTGGTGTYPGGAGGYNTNCNVTTNLAGVAGTQPGGGGSGDNSWTSNTKGGVGGAGQVVIVYTLPTYTWIGTTSTNWNVGTNWSTGSVPTASSNVVIATAANQPVISAASVCNDITLNSGTSLTINNTLGISGNWTNNGSTVSGTGTVTLSSATAVIGGTATTTFPNLTSTGTSVTMAINTTVTGNFIISAGQFNVSGTATSYTLTVGGNYTQSGGNFVVSQGASSSSLNVAGTFTLSSGLFALELITTSTGGTVTVAGAGGTTISGTGEIIMDYAGSTSTCTFQTTAFTSNGTGNTSKDGNITNSSLDFGLGTTVNHCQFKVSGNFSHSSSNVFYTSATAQVGSFIFNGTSTQTLSYTGTNSAYTSYTVNNGAILQLVTNFTQAASGSPSSIITVNGTLDAQTFIMAGASTSETFTLGAGATLKTANVNGVFSGTVGSISSSFSARTFNAAANYIFSGTASQTANFSNTTMNNLTIANTGATTNTVSLNAAITVNGALAINTGILDASTFQITGNATNTFTIASGATFRTAGTTTFPTLFTTANTTFNVNSIFEYYGATQTVSTVPTYGNLTITTAGIKTAATGSLNIAGNMLINTGATFAANAANPINVSGNWTTTGTYTKATETVTFNGGAAQTFNPGTSSFNNIAITNTVGSVSLAANLTATGTFTVNGAGGFNANAKTNTVTGLTSVTSGTYTTGSGAQAFNGGLTVNGGTFTGSTGAVTATDVVLSSGTLTAPSTGSFTITGNWTNSGGAFINNSGTVTLNGSTGTETIAGNSTFYNLILSNTGAFTNFGTSITTIANNLSATGGTMVAGTSTIIFTGSAGQITGGNGKNFYNLQINSGASITAVTTGGNNISIAGSYTNNGTFTQAIARNTTFSGTGTQTLSGTGSTTFGNVKISNSSTVSAGSHSFSLLGDWTNNGTYTAGTETVTFAGTAAQVFNGPTTFNNVIINSTLVTLSDPATVSGIITFTNGRLNTTVTNILTLTNTAPAAMAGGSTTSFVNGPVIWNLPNLTSSSNVYTYLIGTGTTYLPFSATSITSTSLPSLAVQAFLGSVTGSGDGTTLAVSGSLSTTEYWVSQTTNGFITRISVNSLTRQTPVSPYNVIAESSTNGGDYTSYGGTPSGNSILNSTNIPNTLLRFYVMAKEPTITISSALTPTSVTSCSGTASSNMTLSVSGSGLINGITVTPPTGFEVSLSPSTGFGSSVIVGSGGTIASTPVYVRLSAADAAGTYSGNISLTSTGAATITTTIAASTVNAATVITTQPVGATYCQNAAATPLSVTATGTGTLTYQWYSNTTSSTSGSTNIGGATASTYTPSTTTAGTTYYYVIVTSPTCGSVTSTIVPVVINPTVTAGTISGTSPLCIGATATYTSNGTTGGTWSSTNTSVATVVAGTGVVTATVPGTTNITYTISSGCGAPVSAFKTLTVNPNANAGTVSGTSPLCIGATATYSSNGDAGGTWSSTNTSVAIVVAGTGVVTATGAGTTNITYTVSSGCGSPVSSFKTLTVNVDTWTGGTSSAWGTASNWTCGVPDATTDVSIPNGTPRYPVVSGSYSIRGITIASGASVTIDSATVGVLTIKGAFSNAGVLTNNGRIVLNGTAAQSFPGGSIANLSMNTLEINNTSGVTLDNSIIIRGAILPTAGTTALGSNYITLRSDSINIGGTPQFRSARIGVDGSATPFTYGTGRFVIERYFHAKRAWRLITAPVTMASSSTIFNGWQLGGRTTASTPPAASGTGVLITGAYTTTNGFDINGTNKNPSLKIHDPVTGALNSVPGTKIKLSPGTYATGGTGENIGYFNFVRGDRDPSLLTLTKTNRTTLRDTGIVQTGTQTFTFPLAVNTNPKFILLPNPYASPVDFQTIYNNNQSNIEERFYAWDPELGDATSVGGYVTYDLLSGPTPDNPPGHQNQYIQSTQAVYLQTSNSGSVPVTVNESDKAPDTINAPLFRPLIYATSQLRVNLNFVNADNSTLLADGILAQFSSAYSDAVDKNDGLKFLNPAESFAFSRDGKLLSIERRNQLTKEDTLYFSFTKGTKRTYQLEFVPDGLDGTAAFLIDSYLKTSTPVSMSQASTLNFTITTDAGSAAADRFMIVFRPSATLPVTFTKVKAYQQGSNINVEWNIENEQNIKEYEVERSTDGRTFSKSITLTATRNNGTTAAYTWPDASPANGANYYRIKSVSKSGEIRYSSIVKVTIGNGRPLIAVYPNPASGGTINLQLINQPAGRYGIRLLDKIGQVILVKQTEHSEGSSTETLQVSEAMAHGNYQLEITKPDNNKTVINVVY